MTSLSVYDRQGSWNTLSALNSRTFNCEMNTLWSNKIT
jgi:hypothetical protein